MDPQIHLALQYLATANISFLAKKEDDSHTNIGFNHNKNRFESRILDSSGHFLALNLNDFSLELLAANTYKISLHEKKHEEIVDWISQHSKNLNTNKSYSFNLHYDLPYGDFANLKFINPDTSEITKEIAMRTLAYKIILEFLEITKIASEIRVWPHHFDTGAFGKLSKNTEKSFGVGLAIPDSIMDDYYFYISGYQNHQTIPVKGFPILKNGSWKSGQFNGAILPASGIDFALGVSFLKEALLAYKN